MSQAGIASLLRSQTDAYGMVALRATTQLYTSMKTLFCSLGDSVDPSASSTFEYTDTHTINQSCINEKI
jgi:hypothetical protein